MACFILLSDVCKGTACQDPRPLRWEGCSPGGWGPSCISLAFSKLISITGAQVATQRNHYVIYFDTKTPGCVIKISSYSSKVRKQRNLKLPLHIGNGSSKRQVDQLNTHSGHL